MLGIIIVVYKSFDDTVTYIKSEIPKITIPYKLVIVNNASSLNESLELANACDAILVNESEQVDKNNNLFVISEKDNLGYARGNNVGAKFLNENFSIDYLLISNNDIELIEPNVINKLLTFLDNNSEIALAGPMITTPDGGHHPGHVKYVSIYRRIGWNFLHFLRKRKTENTEDEFDTTPYECNWVSGCFFVIKNEVFQKVHGFDNGTFLYGEETILSERLRRTGYKTYFYPDASVLHNHSQTIGKSFNEYKQQKLQMISHIYFYKNYKHTPQFIIWLYRLSFWFRHKLI